MIAKVFDSALNENERSVMKDIDLIPGDVARPLCGSNCYPGSHPFIEQKQYPRPLSKALLQRTHAQPTLKRKNVGGL